MTIGRRWPRRDDPWRQASDRMKSVRRPMTGERRQSSGDGLCGDSSQGFGRLELCSGPGLGPSLSEGGSHGRWIEESAV